MFSPEEGKLYGSRDVSFNEKLVFTDKYKSKELEHWEKIETEINQNTWFTEFEKETKDAETKDEMKRGRGRPRKNKANDDIQITDDDTHALLANINGDPVTYEEAINSSDRLKWMEEIENELESLNKNQVCKLVDRSIIIKENRKTNIIDSRWVLKRKIEPDNSVQSPTCNKRF